MRAPPVTARRVTWLAGILAVSVSICAVVIAVVHRSDSDCRAVRTLVEKGDDFNAAFADSIRIDGSGMGRRGDLQRTYDELAESAENIADAGLARRALDVISSAGAMVDLVARPTDAAAADAVTQWQNELVDSLQSFNENMAALTRTCPDDTQRVRIGSTH